MCVCVYVCVLRWACCVVLRLCVARGLMRLLRGHANAGALPGALLCVTRAGQGRFCAGRADAVHHAGLVGRVWRRPTFPHLEVQYHGRWRFSRPSSGWDRVLTRRHGHQTVSANPACCKASARPAQRLCWRVWRDARRARVRFWFARVCCAGVIAWQWMAAVHGGPLARVRQAGWFVEWDEPFGRLGPVG